MSLLVTGTVGIDTVYTPEGHAESVLGGSGAYFAAAASFYAPVRLVAVVGEDFPEAYMEVLRRFRSVDLSGLEVRRGAKTFSWGAKYHPDMNRRDTLYTELGVVADSPPPVPPAFRDSRFVFLANTHPAVQRTMLDQVSSRVLTVADTMDLWISTARADLLVLLRQVDGLVLNYDEAELLSGRRNTVAAGRHILEMGPRFVVIKKGEHGALLVHREGVAALPAYPTERVVDPTGCGDTFAGGMLGYLAATTDPGRAATYDAVRAALVHGTVVASFTIESFSLDRLRTLTRAEIDARVQEYAAMVRV